jgi:hypothetical protein
MSKAADGDHEDGAMDARTALDLQVVKISSNSTPVVRGAEVPLDAELAVLMSAMPALSEDGNGKWRVLPLEEAGVGRRMCGMCGACGARRH